MTTATITPIASLDWPTKPLQTARIERAGSSYLAYESRLLNRRAFLHSSSFYQKQNGTTSEPTSSSEPEETKKEYDLLAMSERKLSKLNYYQVLQRNLPLHASADEIRKAYHKACLKYHPDKTGRGEEDEVFLLVKAAFDTLSDPVKRRSYDSTVDFDESIPKEGVEESEFYEVYGPVFERNLRFASFNDPAKQAGNKDKEGEMTSPAGKKKGKKKGGKGNDSPQSKETCPSFGDDSTPLDQVHAFYDFWVHFESWRDFTLKASKETEHDMDAADSRDEKVGVLIRRGYSFHFFVSCLFAVFLVTVALDETRN
jgi:DnaJ family protein C protein 2